MTPELDIDGPAAPPRANGELSFNVPWQRRLFATTMALCDAGRVEYADFRDRLIAKVADNDRRAASSEHDDENDRYWSAWQTAIETMMAESGYVTAGELRTRAQEFAEHHH